MFRKIILKIVSPISPDEDLARGEFILNVLLLASTALSFISAAINFIRWSVHVPSAVPIGAPFYTLCFFLFLFALSKKGFYRTAAYALLCTLFLLVGTQIYAFGADLPTALLSYVLIIVMAGVLLNTRVAFATTILIGMTLTAIAYFQIHHLVSYNTQWKAKFDFIDITVFTIIFLIIATVSWLSNREIDRSLIRARKSEAELKYERDSLEIKVEQKTRELKEAQAEKMAQLYRFAEFGRLSSGVFHDLINPLSAVSVNMLKLKNGKGESIDGVRDYIDRAVLATKKMEDLVTAVRKQLSREENRAPFFVNDEIRQVINILGHKLLTNAIKVDFSEHANVSLFGDATKFHYAMLNLIINAVDSYEGQKSKRHVVEILSDKKDGHSLLEVKDWGSGIRPEHFSKIFEPFFTTKPGTKGIGVGLSMTKRIIEKDFSGTISVESKYGRGTVFKIKIPIKPSC